MVSALLSRCLMLILGTLYPAYRSYKAIKNKDVREHVKWMMYWIVFALFTTLETFLDIFFSWFPFYYEIKILFILWVLSPATRGSSLLYKKVVHPMLTSREKEIDELIEKTKHQGYNTFLQLFTSGFQYASNLFVHSAMKGQYLLGNQLKKSLSMNDVYETDGGNVNGSSGGVNQNDNDMYRMPDTINEDDEDIDDFDAESERIRRLNNRQVYESSYKPGKKQSITALNGQHSSNRDYEIVDDGILVDDLNQKTRANSRRRASAKQMSTTNYKTNEASHFGTITRGSAASSGATTASMLSGRKVKLNSVPTLNAQHIFSNEIDS